MSDLLQRAMAAFFKHEPGATNSQPSANLSGEVEHDGKQYVVLRNVEGVLAVYRVRTDGVLKRLKRWHGEIEGV